MKPTVYIETTIPSFLTARPSLNLVVAGKQAVTRHWWENRRGHYAPFISQYVMDEAAAGDSVAAGLRVEAIREIPMLDIDERTLLLAGEILSTGLIPPKARADAAHIAVAARHGMDFLLTWNCKHIANAEIVRKLVKVTEAAGHTLPTICTPDELFGSHDNDEDAYDSADGSLGG